MSPQSQSYFENAIHKWKRNASTHERWYKMFVPFLQQVHMVLDHNR